MKPLYAVVQECGILTAFVNYTDTPPWDYNTHVRSVNIVPFRRLRIGLYWFVKPHKFKWRFRVHQDSLDNCYWWLLELGTISVSITLFKHFNESMRVA